MSKIVKKKDLDVLIESTLQRAGITKKEPKKVVTEEKKVITEEKVNAPKKGLINEDLKRELEKFNKLTNYTYKK